MTRVTAHSSGLATGSATGWAAPGVDIGVIVPQVRLGYDELLHKARRVEALGLHSFWIYDHLYAPMLPAHPAFEGWTLATALLANTSRLRVGHLVLCNNFRHPALLAKMATTLDVISNGRLELGIGSGSYEAEHAEAGLPWGSFAERTGRLAEALEVITAMFSGEPTTYVGDHYQVRDLPNLPPPTQSPRPPLHIGGAGERYTLPLVARHADVWNVPTYTLGEFEAKRDALARACDAIGRDRSTIRIALEAVLVVAPDDAAVADAREQTLRRYPGPGWGVVEGGFVGTPTAIVDRMQMYADMGVSLFTFFLHDRATDATLDLLAAEVAPAVRA